MTAPSVSCTVPCNLCGSSVVSTLSHISRSGKPLRTVICSNCGLVWSDPRPHNPTDFYKNEYRKEYKNTVTPKLKHVYRAGRVALSRLEKIRHILSESMCTLDAGSGGGEFANLLSSLGNNVRCIEPNEGYADYSACEYGLCVDVGFVQDVIGSHGQYDLITFWHVLEHTEDPAGILKSLGEHLTEDGTLVVEVPNVEAVCQSPKNRFHEAHLYSFNPETLRAIGRKAGLCEVDYQLSGDRGNVTMFFKKADKSLSMPDSFEMPDNAERIAGFVRNHTNIRHYLSKYPYTRIWDKLRNSQDEKREIRNFTSGKQILNHLYVLSLNDRTQMNPSGATAEETP